MQKIIKNLLKGEFTVNNCVLVGNIGKDPVLKYTQNGKAKCDFSVAPGNGKDKDPTWHNVQVWGDLAERVSKLSKGKHVTLQGKIDNYSYEKDGQKKYGNRILAFSVWWDFSNDDKKGFDTPFVIPPKKSQESSFSADDIPF